MRLSPVQESSARSAGIYRPLQQRTNPEPRWLEADLHKVHYAKIRIVRPRPGRGRA
jgi:hypothetical protein